MLPKACLGKFTLARPLPTAKAPSGIIASYAVFAGGFSTELLQRKRICSLSDEKRINNNAQID